MWRRKLNYAAVTAVLSALAVAPPAPAAENPVVKERPTAYHLYLHIQPVAGLNEIAQTRHQQSLARKLETTLETQAPQKLLSGRVEQSLDGQTFVRWTVTAWTPSQAAAEIAHAKTRFKPKDKVRIELSRVDHKTVEFADAREMAEDLKSDTGAFDQYLREKFGPSFPRALLTSENGGSVFDFSAIKNLHDMDAAAVLFDAAGSPRDPAVISEQIRLARSKPRAKIFIDPHADAPPPPLQHDGFVTAASDDAKTQDILRGLIYASRGYSNGFGEGSGLHGPMGLSRATFRWAQGEANAEQKEILGKGISDDRANILAGAILFDRLQSQFGGDLSRAVAAFHVGPGNVRKHGGIPPNAKYYLGRFQLAHQQGIRRALDPLSPRTARRIKPVIPVSPIDAIVRRAREESHAILRGEPPTGRRESFRNVPVNLVNAIRREATTGEWQIDPNALIALSEAEGGVNAGTSHANARGVLQITPETARWECGLSRAELQNRSKNIACAEKVYKRRLDRVDGDIVLAWALYNTKVKWHGLMIREKRVANIKETVRHVTRAAYRYYQLTGDSRFDPGTRAFREKYFTSRQALAWSAQSYRDLQQWDRGEGFRGDGTIRIAERVPALEGTLASVEPSRSGRWRRNSTGTHWYRSSRIAGQRWDIHPYRRNGIVTTPPV
ncbi:MAG: hypothetical protein COB53_02330 [Elusimicrobia bacterium]|nr:MAG: hypothetical protein COB53_02330 [Elusimicrobiota bacterium]